MNPETAPTTESATFAETNTGIVYANPSTGFVKITSTIPVLSLSLNAEVFPVFSALPPGDLPSTTVLVP